MIHFDISGLEEEKKELEQKISKPDFWDNQEKSSIILTKMKRIQSKIENYRKLQAEIENLESLNELLLEEEDIELGKEVLQSTINLEEKIKK